MHNRSKLDLRGRAAWHKRRSFARLVQGCAHTDSLKETRALQGLSELQEPACALELHSPLSIKDTLRHKRDSRKLLPRHRGKPSLLSTFSGSLATISS